MGVVLVEMMTLRQNKALKKTATIMVMVVC